MSDELLHYYERELSFLKDTANEFAEANPKIAGRLRVNADTIEDPHASRLLEGVAYLNSRIQKRLDDDFPELTNALMATLFPHYLKPIPALAIAQVTPDKSLDKVIKLEKGTEVKTDSIDRESCYFKTCYPTVIAPLEVEIAELIYPPFNAPSSSQYSQCKSALHLKLKTTSKDLSCDSLDLEQLRFFLKGLPQNIYPLYELIFSSTQGCVIANDENDTTPLSIPKKSLNNIGFDVKEGLFADQVDSFTEYRLLSEFFAFPEKFLFFEINQLAEKLSTNENDSFHLYLYFSESNEELEHHINEETFALNCTPIINLFNKKIDPIHMDQSQYQYHLVPDSRQIEKLEIHSVNKVTASFGNNKEKKFLPFHGLDHESIQSNSDCYWFTKRRTITEPGIHQEKASELDITLVNLDYQWYTSADMTLNLDCLCFNRNLPNKLPFGSGQPQLYLLDDDIGDSRFSCITHPTKVIRPPLNKNAYWRLYSHLQLNMLSLSNSKDATQALKEIFRLYEYCGSAQSIANIDAIFDVTIEQMVAPVKVSGYTTMCRGNRVTLIMNEEKLVGKSCYLFAEIIDKFLGLYCSINSFTQLVLKSKTTGKIINKWPLRAGKKQLL